MAPSPLCCLSQTGKEVRPKRGDLNLFQVLNLRAHSLFADAGRVPQPASSPRTAASTFLFTLIHSQALSFPDACSLHLHPQDFKSLRSNMQEAEGSSCFPQTAGSSANLQTVRENDFQLGATWNKVELMMLQGVVTPGLGTANLTMFELSSSPQCPVSSAQLSGGFQDVFQVIDVFCFLSL